MDTYERLAHKALQTMKIKLASTESIAQLIQETRYAVLPAGSEAEDEITHLSKETSDLIEREGAIDEMRSLLQKLHSEVTFNYSD